MNYLEEVQKNMEILIKHVNECKNERIQSGVVEVYPLLAQEFQQLDQEEQDLNTKMPFLERLIKLRTFAQTKGNLDNVWKYLHMTKYQKQDQFIEVLRDLPQYIKQSREQQAISISTFLRQSCAELYSHQLVTFNLRINGDNQIKASDDEEEQNCGCITYVSPEVENTRLFKINMKLPGLMNKVKKLNTLLSQSQDCDQNILNLTLDNKNKRATIWSTEEIVGYYVTKKPTPESLTEMEQKIYLDTGMVIQLTQSFALTIEWAYNGADTIVNDNLNPIRVNKPTEQDPKKPILQNPDYYIRFASQFEKVTFYPTKNPIKIGEHMQLPSGYEILLYYDGVGHYIEVIESLNKFAPFVKSRRQDNKLLQFNTQKVDFNIRLILEQKVSFEINTNLQVVWDGKDLFDL